MLYSALIFVSIGISFALFGFLVVRVCCALRLLTFAALPTKVVATTTLVTRFALCRALIITCGLSAVSTTIAF